LRASLRITLNGLTSIVSVSVSWNPSLPTYGLDVARRAVLYEALAPGFFGPIVTGKAEKEGQGSDPTGGAINLLIEEAKKQAT
jgi:hypothetical protein